jgi:hypothetical protein
MLTITVEDEDDVYRLFGIMIAIKTHMECMSGECECRDEDNDLC